MKVRGVEGEAVKEGSLVVQEDHKDKIVSIIEEDGFHVKRKGG